MALAVKSPPSNAGGARDLGSIPGSGRSPGEGHGYPLQYSCLENYTGGGTVHGAALSLTWLSALTNLMETSRPSWKEFDCH